MKSKFFGLLLFAIFVSLVSFAEEPHEEVFSKLPPKFDPSKENIALARANSRLFQLTVLAAKKSPPIKVTGEMRALAFDALYQYSYFENHRMQTGLGDLPILIWIKSKERVGNSTLLDLIAEVITPNPFSRRRLESSDYGLFLTADELADSIQKKTQGQKTIVLDDFSGAFSHLAFGKTELLNELLDRSSNASTILILDDNDTEKILDPISKEAIDGMADGTGPLHTWACDAAMTLFADMRGH
ncbi:unnamed protein product [Sphagnum balticum]